MLAPEWEDPQGVPISAIVFGGRRASTVPLVTESRDWQHGTFIGATLSSETTAAAKGKVGRCAATRWPCCRSSATTPGDYFQHWIDVGKGADATKLPQIFYVNWFRRGEDGRFLWPGFGENSRVLKWMVERMEGTRGRRRDRDRVRPGAPTSWTWTGWTRRPPTSRPRWTSTSRSGRPRSRSSRSGSTTIGDSLPTSMRDELEALKLRLGA